MAALIYGDVYHGNPLVRIRILGRSSPRLHPPPREISLPHRPIVRHRHQREQLFRQLAVDARPEETPER